MPLIDVNGFIFFRICKHDPVHEEVHDPNPLYGCVGPGNVLHRQPVIPGCVAVGRQKFRDLSVGFSEQVDNCVLLYTLLFFPVVAEYCARWLTRSGDKAGGSTSAFHTIQVDELIKRKFSWTRGGAWEVAHFSHSNQNWDGTYRFICPKVPFLLHVPTFDGVVQIQKNPTYF